jgi:two-component system phosphate regulon sensor histidine kinase PhoR
MPPAWTWLVFRLLALLAGGLLVGWLYGQPLAGALLAALGALAWNVLNLYRLERWLLHGEPVEIPDGSGVWPQVFARIAFLRQRAKRRGKRFRRLVKELRASTEAFPDGGVVLNAEHEILNYNQAARQLLGLRKRRDKGQRIENLLRHPAFVSYLQQPGERQTVELPAPAGADTWISCRLIPYGPGQSLLLIRDITQGIKLERMRRDFVANASHELRSPLTVISGYLDTMAEDEAISDAWRQPVTVMQDQAGRMRRLIEDLLHLSRLESGDEVPRDRVVDLAALVTAVGNEAAVLVAEPARIELELESRAGLLGEETEIRSIISNLVSNAIRYTPPEGRITISWSVDESGGHLAVADTGIGIAEEDIPRVTERFYRTDAGRARQRGGTGLGLAIVKHALRRHGAELAVASRLGQGSTFTCHFPRDRVAES